MADQSPHAIETDWQRLFDVLKEVNAHAGRLATFLGLVVGATTFSLKSGALRDAVTAADRQHVSVYAMLALVALALGRAVLFALRALDPPLPLTLFDPMALAAMI